MNLLIGKEGLMERETNDLHRGAVENIAYTHTKDSDGSLNAKSWPFDLDS